MNIHLHNIIPLIIGEIITIMEVSLIIQIFFIDQYDDINGIISIFKNAGYDFEYNVESNKIIFTQDNHYGETSFVGVVSDDNEIVILSGDDFNLLKKSADTLVFE